MATTKFLDFDFTTRDYTKVLCSGSFDLFHYGHVEFLREAKQSGENITVVAGIYSDAELRRIKIEPVFTEEERYKMLIACKWVDEALILASIDVSQNVMQAHGFNYEESFGWIESDPLKGNNSGISTASIIHRILESENICDIPLESPMEKSLNISPKEGDKIVYVAGSFDLFHSGHVKILEDARELGDFLYVGIHNDETVRKYAGKNYPILHLDERVMAVLSCKYVSDVIINAPFHITEELINEFSVDVVAAWEFIDEEYETNNPYEFPIQKGIMMYAEVEDEKKALEDNNNLLPNNNKESNQFTSLYSSSMSNHLLTTEEIVKRVLSKWSNWSQFEDQSARRLLVQHNDFISNLREKEENELEQKFADLNREDTELSLQNLEAPSTSNSILKKC